VRKVYRGQFISPKELIKLQHSLGSMISITSFISTTKNFEIALIFSGNGDARPNFESVIFEIRLDESDLGDEASPFADICQLSSKQDEEEVVTFVLFFFYKRSNHSRNKG
jgi:hypothetical protein